MLVPGESLRSLLVPNYQENHATLDGTLPMLLYLLVRLLPLPNLIALVKGFWRFSFALPMK